MIRNTGTGTYNLKLEFTFGDMQDKMVELSELVTITAQFSEVMSRGKSYSSLLFTGAFIQAVPGLSNEVILDFPWTVNSSQTGLESTATVLNGSI